MSQTLSSLIDQITLSPDGCQLLLSITSASANVSKEQIVCILQHPSLPKFKLNIDGLNEAEALLSELDETSDSNALNIEPIVIARKQDALLNIVIANDKMSAYAEITSAYGGESITLSEMKLACDQLGIKFGLLPKSMLNLLNTCKKCAVGKIYKVNIAFGKQPIDGEDSRFKKLIKTDNHRTPKPRLLANGKVDMRDLGKTFTVQDKTLLMAKTPATVGQPGKTITGEIIEQKQGVDRDFVIGKNTMINPENAMQLISSHHGIPIDEGDFIRIDDIQVLGDINVRTGHVDYDGTVIITGDVQEGMQVKASGDITVMGVIESAKIICGGDLTVKMPILGHQKQDQNEFSSMIDCKGNVFGTIAQYTHLQVGKNLVMSNQLMHCKTECKGSVSIHDESFNKGSIIGGITSAYGDIVTTTMGTSAGNKTNIDLIGQFDTFLAEKKELIKAVQQVDDLLQKVKKEDIKANSLLDPLIRKKTKALLNTKKAQFRAKSDELQSKLFDVKMKITHYYSSTRLTVTSKLYSDITVSIGKQRWYSANSVGPSVICVENEEMKLTKYQRA